MDPLLAGVRLPTPIFVGASSKLLSSLPLKMPTLRRTHQLRQSPRAFGPASGSSVEGTCTGHETVLVEVPRAVLPVASTLDKGSEAAVEDAWQVFLKERKRNGDFISKVSDSLWRKDGPVLDTLWRKDELVVDDLGMDSNKNNTPEMKAVEDEENNGYLKLTKTKEWISGNAVAPLNKKRSAQERIYNSEKTKKLNTLRYEALKRELFLLTAGIGVSCSGYCLLTLSVQAAVSYAMGVAFSCLYLQLLCYHSDNLSKKDVPSVFLQKPTKKIGVRTEDLKYQVVRVVKGSSLALSSPRLVLPAALYGIWALSHQFTTFFDFQIAPAMFGLFAYKAAALVQVYRDNEGLRMVLPDDEFSN